MLSSTKVLLSAAAAGVPRRASLLQAAAKRLLWTGNESLEQDDPEIFKIIQAEKRRQYSAMAQTVGFPAAIATRMVLDNEIQRKGMVLPFTKDIYKPMLDRLESEGIKATEKSKYETIV